MQHYLSMSQRAGLYDEGLAARRPLMDTFWSPKGWRSPPKWPAPDVFRCAVEAGVMFAQSRVQNHDGWVAAAREAATGVSPSEVSDAFVASLSNRRLDLRSALGSLAVARRLPEHSFVPVRASVVCAVCGLSGRDEQDLNVLNFERFKWGGVRRGRHPLRGV